jgi:hypothetical protein
MLLQTRDSGTVSGEVVNEDTMAASADEVTGEPDDSEPGAEPLVEAKK